MPTDQQIIYLAPFQGITGSVYREIYTQHFPHLDKLFTPFFTSIYKQKSLSSKADEIKSTHHNKIEVVPQILSNDGEEIKRFAGICSEKGFEEINWNLGCPFKRVALKKRGSGLLPYPEMVEDILKVSMSNMPVKLSVKCRLGYNSPDEVLRLLPVFSEYGISEVGIHARLGKQLYKGNVDLPAFEKACKMSSLPVIYNGDIFSVQEFQLFQNRFDKVKGWMIGRGLLVDPFLPADIKNIDYGIPDERKEKAFRFTTDLYLAYRKKLNDRLHAINIMKELWEYMAFSFDHPGKVFGRIKKTKTFDEYEDAVKLVFDNYGWLGSEAKLFNFSSI